MYQPEFIERLLQTGLTQGSEQRNVAVALHPPAGVHLAGILVLGRHFLISLSAFPLIVHRLRERGKL